MLCVALGLNAWSAQNSDFGQYLIMDLGQPMNVTGIATQGRAHGTEYVLEYAISYGSNGLDYADYKDAGGNIKVRPRGQRWQFFYGFYGRDEKKSRLTIWVFFF